MQPQYLRIAIATSQKTHVATSEKDLVRPYLQN